MASKSKPQASPAKSERLETIKRLVEQRKARQFARDLLETLAEEKIQTDEQND